MCICYFWPFFSTDISRKGNNLILDGVELVTLVTLLSVHKRWM